MRTTRDFVCCGDRYAFDFGHCNYKKGFAQIDTRNDASYFGMWANPATLRIVSFVEGDITVQDAETPEEFTRELFKIRAFYGEDFRGVDGMCDETIIEQFRAIGAGELLH